MSKTIFTAQFIETVLSGLVQDKQFLREAAPVLKPEYLETQIYSLAAESIFNAYSRDGNPPSRAGLLNDLVNGLVKINRVKGADEEKKLAVMPAQKLIDKIFAPITESISDVKDKFLSYCRTKEMQTTILEMYTKLESGEATHDEVMGEVRKTYMRGNQARDNGIDFFKDIGGLSDDLNAMKSQMHSSGFQSIDKRMGGGVSPGTLTTWIAPPKGGKSMTLVNVGYGNLIRGKTVVEFTLEISARKIRKRYVSRISGIPMNELGERTAEATEKCNSFYAKFKPRLIIKEYPTGTASIDTFRGYLYWLQGQHNIKPDVVIVDYGDLIRGVNGGEEERFVQRGAYEGMRALASEFDCSFFTASQCNREATNKALIKMQDIAEAFAKCAVSDHILSICQTDLEAAQNRARLYFAGSREAESGGTFPIRYNWSTATMLEIDKEDEKPPTQETMGGPDPDYF